eukprot:3519867-Rhodomonas_salina.1
MRSALTCAAARAGGAGASGTDLRAPGTAFARPGHQRPGPRISVPRSCVSGFGRVHAVCLGGVHAVVVVLFGKPGDVLHRSWRCGD